MKQKKIIKICWTVESQVCKFLGCEFALHLLRHRYRTFSKIIVQVSEAFTMCLHVYSGLFVHLSVNFLTVQCKLYEPNRILPWKIGCLPFFLIRCIHIHKTTRSIVQDESESTSLFTLRNFDPDVLK